MTKITPERASSPAFREALINAGLPTADLGAAESVFFRLEDADDRVLGYGGIEIYGTKGLLRSLVVLPDHRRVGQGRAMALGLIAEARARGLTELWLLTTTAADFFARLGFKRADRGSAPGEVAASKEFSSICPASAVCMRLELSGVSRSPR